MSDLCRKVREAEVESYPTGRKTTVPIYERVEPVGTLTVDRYSDARSDVVYGEYGYGIVAPHLPPGKYLIVKADDE